MKGPFYLCLQSAFPMFSQDARLPVLYSFISFKRLWKVILRFCRPDNSLSEMGSTESTHIAKSRNTFVIPRKLLQLKTPRQKILFPLKAQARFFLFLVYETIRHKISSIFIFLFQEFEKILFIQNLHSIYFGKNVSRILKEAAQKQQLGQ